MLSKLVITFLPRSKHLLISRLQSPSAVILQPPKIKSVTVSIVSPSICHEVMGPDAMIFFECWILSQLFHSPLSPSSRGSLVLLRFLPYGWCHILECEVKWALGSITTNKASGGNGIPVELFQILKDDAVKVLHSICLRIWKTQQWPQDGQRSVFFPIPKKGNAKECSNYHNIVNQTKKLKKKIRSQKINTYSR